MPVLLITLLKVKLKCHVNQVVLTPQFSIFARRSERRMAWHGLQGIDIKGWIADRGRAVRIFYARCRARNIAERLQQIAFIARLV